MKFVLIDDMGDPLGRLALELAKQARVQNLSVSEIVLVWPSSEKEPSERLQNAISNLKKEPFFTQELKQPKSKEELASIIANFANDEEAGGCMLVSDLNMDDIELGAGNKNGNWLDPNGAVPLAIKTFLEKKSRYALFHSGQGINAEIVATQLDPTKLRAFPSRKAFDVTTRPEEGVADEIERVLSKTPIEKIWKHPDTNNWFGNKETIKHNFVPAHSQSFWKEACKVMGNVFPEAVYNAPFHESLKGLAGSCFAGSYDSGSTRYSLRLGSVALIAFLAFNAAVSVGDADQNGEINPNSFWMNMPTDLAKRVFLKTEDATHNRRTAVAFYWLFYKLFDKSHGGNLKSMEVMEDGFRLIFNWNTEERLIKSLETKYRTAMKAVPETSGADEFSRPENTTSAILALEKWLAFSPGCVVQLSHPNAIDILSPSANGR